ncbi:MAG: hypothetical protein A2277_05355 [Desulfobacterales bacterium RIFOXYA12_FULL_46_15]|nr:MAG: hypothetical protein A2277_05355 [Desulfobacterales bacterium RIFOXYA12_FULL_46_15]
MFVLENHYSPGFNILNIIKPFLKRFAGNVKHKTFKRNLNQILTKNVIYLTTFVTNHLYFGAIYLRSFLIIFQRFEITI